MEQFVGQFVFYSFFMYMHIQIYVEAVAISVQVQSLKGFACIPVCSLVRIRATSSKDMAFLEVRLPWRSRHQVLSSRPLPFAAFWFREIRFLPQASQAGQRIGDFPFA